MKQPDQSAVKYDKFLGFYLVSPHEVFFTHKFNTIQEIILVVEDYLKEKNLLNTATEVCIHQANFPYTEVVNLKFQSYGIPSWVVKVARPLPPQPELLGLE